MTDLMSAPWWMSEQQWADEIRADTIRAMAAQLDHSEATTTDVFGVLARHGSYSDEPALANAARHCLRQNFEPADAILAALTWQHSRVPNVGDGFQVALTLPINRRSTWPGRTGEHLIVNRYEPAPGMQLWCDHVRGEVGEIVGHRQTDRGLEVFARISPHRRDLAALAVAGRLGSSAGFRMEDMSESVDGTVVGRAITHEVSLVTGERGASLMPGAEVRLAVYQPAARRVVSARERDRIIAQARAADIHVREVGRDGVRVSAPIGRVLG